MPSLPPVVKGYLFYDGVWNDVSNKMSQTESITIDRGADSEQGEASPTKASLKMDNRSGDFSPRNPNSPLFDKIGRNTPMKIAVEQGSPYLLIPDDGLFDDSYLTAVDQVELDFAGDLDIRIDGASEIWQLFDTGTALALAERWEFTGNQLCWFFARHRTGHLYFAWSTNGTTVVGSGRKSTEVIPFFNGERAALRVTLDVDNGLGGYTVRFYYSNQIDGEWTELGEPVVTTSGTTSVFNGAGSASVNIGASEGGTMPDSGGAMDMFRGKIYAYQQREGIDGPIRVDLDIARDAVVTNTSFSDLSTVLWALNEDATLSNEYVRINGEVPSWPPSRDLSGNDRTTSIEPTGVMRRLDAGNKPLESALLRYLRSIPSQPIDCWPLIDGVQSQGGASLNGGQAMNFWERVSTNTFAVANQKYEWASGTIANWIEPVGLPAEGVAGYLLGDARADATANTSWAIDFFFTDCNDSIPEFEFIDRTVPTDVDGRVTWKLVLNRTTDALDLLFSTQTENAGSISLLEHILAPGIFDKQPHHIRLQVDPGATSDYFVYIDGVFKAGGTHGVPSTQLLQLKFNWFLDSEPFVGFPYGFITYWGLNYPPVGDVYNAFLGFPGDKTGARFDRLLAEQGLVPGLSTQGGSGGEPRFQEEMGTQGLQKFIDLLQQCASSDVGILAEMRDAGNLYLRARSTLYNQAPRFTLDFSNGVISAPFKPLDDDKLTENDVVVKRINGSSSQAVEETGRMSIQDPPNGVGRYDVSKDLSLFTDAQTADLAFWFLHMGTFDGLRYTRLTVDLANPRVYAMVHKILNTDLGDTIRITNLPNEYGPDDVDVMVRGYTEDIGPESWKITFNCSPGLTWDNVAVAGDGNANGDRVDTSSSNTVLSIDSNDTTIRVSSGGDLWINVGDDPYDFPIPVRIGGEVISVASITSFIQDTYNRTVATGWGNATSGQTWVTTGGAAADFSVEGV